MVQMNQFAGQKLRHRCREQTYGHQGGKAAGGGGDISRPLPSLVLQPRDSGRPGAHPDRLPAYHGSLHHYSPLSLLLLLIPLLSQLLPLGSLFPGSEDQMSSNVFVKWYQMPLDRHPELGCVAGHVDKVVSYNLLPATMSESGTQSGKWGGLRLVGDGGLKRDGSSQGARVF